MNPISNPVIAALKERELRERGLVAPRSWPKEEKLMFLSLPEPIQRIIGLREKQRETELRRVQNELANLKKQTQTKTQEDNNANQDVREG